MDQYNIKFQKLSKDFCVGDFVKFLLNNGFENIREIEFKSFERKRRLQSNDLFSMQKIQTKQYIYFYFDTSSKWNIKIPSKNNEYEESYVLNFFISANYISLGFYHGIVNYIEDCPRAYDPILFLIEQIKKMYDPQEITTTARFAQQQTDEGEDIDAYGEKCIDWDKRIKEKYSIKDAEYY